MTVPTANLGDFCDIVQGGRLKLSGDHFVPEGYPAYGAGGLNGYLPVAEFHGPGVILSAIGARCGKCFLADGDWITLANTQVILPDPTRADARYLWYQLNDEARWHRSGTAQPFIKPSDVKESRVALPPLAEQRRIAAILDQADELRATRRTALAEPEKLQKSIFLDMFGDPRSNPTGWPVFKIGDLVRGFEAGKSILTNEGDSLRARYRVIKVSAITSGTFVPGESKPVPPDYDPPAEHFVRKGDLLFSRANTEQLVGASVLVECDPDNTLLSDKIWRFVWNDDLKVLPSYVWQVLQTPGIRSAIGSLATGTSGSMKNISQAKLLQLELPVPPMELQKQVEARLKVSRRVAMQCRRSLDELTSLFASLQHRAFRGEV